jgi:hypothetical protein
MFGLIKADLFSPVIDGDSVRIFERPRSPDPLDAAGLEEEMPHPG